ncbi:UrvD/REP family ATP-dependent DNA helicase [Actinomyces succiniciruminis]|uniref:DNA 3'-5' helicase n=1 Tax=Actinomyces succiniciruminis TaxID=1522002 RepID=A0A1L7RQZ5_9ACTO|nr:UrvD/REP family ATP-dependent DNA helicase [Actinomyces succiniciruminis]CED92714.1 Possible UvrD/REP helicase [Actinomyces succiniciruminis]
MTSPTGAPRLLPPLAQPPLPEPDASAARVLARAADGANLVVLGAPGTGKTTTALRLLVEAVTDRHKEALLLAPTRARADRLRERASHLLSLAGASSGTVRVRTPVGLALTILTTSFTQRPDPLPAPVLLAGAEEDAALAGLVPGAGWGDLPAEAVESRAFRTELRNLLARAGELGVTAEQLADLGAELNVPIWRYAAPLLRTWDAQGRPSAANRSTVRKMDSARLQDRAREVLDTWDADGVRVPRPVPDVVIVDDYQDCTAATARLLVALSGPDSDGHRTQIVALGDPDAAVEVFRGGNPSLLNAAEDRSGLAAERLMLRTVHRGTPELARVWAAQADRIPITGTATHRHPEYANGTAAAGAFADRSAAAPAAPQANRGGDEDDEAGCGGAPDEGSAVGTELHPAPPSGVETLIASGPLQQTAQIARILRSEHVHHNTAWDQMAVIVRSAGTARAVSRELRHHGVPLASTTPAVLLRAEPAAAAIINACRAALAGTLGDADTPPEWATAFDLLTSPLIGLTNLDLRRLRRRLCADRPAEAGRDENLLGVLATPAAATALVRELADEPLAEQAMRLERAARVVAALRDVVEAAREEERLIDAEALMWAAWQASDCAETWRAMALAPHATRAAALTAEAAEHDLDVVTVLFKRAEVWAERHPGAAAGDFLNELAAEVLPSDTVAPQGIRPPGVAVLTPAAAAGAQWEVVVVAGVERDAWPDLRLRDGLTRSGLLVDAVTGRLPLAADGRRSADQDPTEARSQVRGDERRMFLSAISRSGRRLIVTAALDGDCAPSSFLLEVAEATGQTLFNDDGELEPRPDVADLTLPGLVGELRAAAVAGRLERADAGARARGRQAEQLLAALARDGVSAADPANWAGLGQPTSTAPLVGAGQEIRISPSDVDAISQCPLKWFLQRNGGGTGTSDAQRIGMLVHGLAERAEREGLRGEVLRQALEDALPELGYPDTWLGNLARQRVRDMIDRLDAYLGSVTAPALVEQTVDVHLDLPVPDDGEEVGIAAGDGEPQARADGGRAVDAEAGAIGGGPVAAGERIPVRIRGRIDRLEFLDGTPPDSSADGVLPAGQGQRVRVIDFKTGSGKLDVPKRNAQLATYRMALAALGYQVDGTGLAFLGVKPRGTDPGPKILPSGMVLESSPNPDTGEEWDVELLARAARDVSGASLIARSGNHCQWCSLKTSCPVNPEGRRTVA